MKTNEITDELYKILQSWQSVEDCFSARTQIGKLLDKINEENNEEKDSWNAARNTWK